MLYITAITQTCWKRLKLRIVSAKFKPCKYEICPLFCNNELYTADILTNLRGIVCGLY